MESAVGIVLRQRELVMRYGATVATIALALAGVVSSPLLMAQPIPATYSAPMAPSNENVDADGFLLQSTDTGVGSSSPDPLAPLGQSEGDAGEPKVTTLPIEIAEAAGPQMSAGDVPVDAEPPSGAAAILRNWITATGDNGGLPFIVIDKIGAMIFLFDAEGRLIGTTPALLGITPGDDSAPGVGDRELSDIKPEDRTTPAGRFVAKFGLASGNRQVLWVDYETSISLHPVITTNKKERRLQRLRSPSADDNRITYGCINIPTKFYNDVVGPLFADTSGIVYILPEQKYLFEVFPAFRPDVRPASHAESER